VQISALGYYANALSDDANEAEVARNHFRKVIDACTVIGPHERQRLHRRRSLSAASKRTSSSFKNVWPDIIRYADDRGIKGWHRKLSDAVSVHLAVRVNLARTPAIWRRMSR